MTTSHESTLVLGGTGKTGRRIVERLQAAGYPLRVGSRSAHPPFDWHDPQSWTAALQQVGAVYLSYYPDLAVPGAVDTVKAFAAAARANGVRRLVLLSGRGEEEAQRAEGVIQQSGVDWTILRCSWFAQNFSENFLLDAIREGELVLPVGNVAEPFVDAEDIADVAFAALTREGHAGQLYELTGPRLLTFTEAVGEISAAVGREIRFHEISTEAYLSALAGQGVPDEFVWLLEYLFSTVMDGRNAHLADGVQRALGRMPGDFSDYARRTAAEGVWGDSRSAATA